MGKYSDGKIQKGEPDLRNGGNVNTVYFSLSGELFESVAHSLFMINKHTIANPVEHCLESVEKYSDGKIHKGEPELKNDRNVNTVHISSSGEI